MMAAISSVVATGRRMKGRDGLMPRPDDHAGWRGSLRRCRVALAALTVGALTGFGRRLARLRWLAGLGSLARRGGLAGATLTAAGRLARCRHRHRGAVAQPVGAVRHHPVPGLQP